MMACSKIHMTAWFSNAIPYVGPVEAAGPRCAGPVDAPPAGPCSAGPVDVPPAGLGDKCKSAG